MRSDFLPGDTAIAGEEKVLLFGAAVDVPAGELAFAAVDGVGAGERDVDGAYGSCYRELRLN